MDEKQAYERVTAEYERRVRSDSRLEAFRRKLAAGGTNGVGAITLKDAHAYVDRLAQIFGECFGGAVLDIAQGEREGTCMRLMRDRVTDIDEVSEGAQSAVLARQGLNISPKPEAYPEKRIFTLAHSLEDPTATDEQIVRRADSASATVMRSRFDENMKKGARTCAEAGLKTYIVRDGSSKCCEWCAGLAGRYSYGSEPKDVYRRHDNCSCSVVYESGRGRQNVWSKQYWSAEQEREYLRLRDEMKPKRNPTAAEGAQKPMRLTAKQIQALKYRVGGLTFGGNNDNIGKRPYEIPMTREERLGIIRQGVSTDKPIFATDTETNKFASNVKKVAPDPKYYDVSLHGTSTSAEFFGEPIDAYLLASIIRNRKDYAPGKPVRLLSCNTGNTSETGNCFAQLLANELDTHVIAPNDTLWVKDNGELVIGPTEFIDSGDFVPFYSRRV